MLCFMDHSLQSKTAANELFTLRLFIDDVKRYFHHCARIEIEIFVNIFRKSLLLTGQIWLKNVEPFFNKVISKSGIQTFETPDIN